MLVLSRKVGQELVIGDNIRITVNRIGGSRVTLGIVAPDDVRVVRSELEQIVRSFEEEETRAGEAAETTIHAPAPHDVSPRSQATHVVRPGAVAPAEAESALELGAPQQRSDLPGSLQSPDVIAAADGAVAPRDDRELDGAGRGAEGVTSAIAVGIAAEPPLTATPVPYRSSRILSHRRGPVPRNGSPFRDRRDSETTEPRQRLTPERPVEGERSANPPLEHGTPLRPGEPLRKSGIEPVKRAGTDANLTRNVRGVGGRSANDDLGRAVQ